MKALLNSNPVVFLYLFQYIGKANIMMFALHVKGPQTAKRELRESTFFPLSPTGSILPFLERYDFSFCLSRLMHRNMLPGQM